MQAKRRTREATEIYANHHRTQRIHVEVEGLHFLLSENRNSKLFDFRNLDNHLGCSSPSVWDLR
jgi:hypothetical protein